MQAVPDPLQVADAVARHGVSFVLTLVALLFVGLYLLERKENKALRDKILENGKELTAVAINMTTAVNGVKDAMAALAGVLRKR